MSNADSPTPPAKTRLFGMLLPASLDAQLTEIATRLNLTKSGVARLALERGLPIVDNGFSQIERPEA